MNKANAELVPYVIAIAAVGVAALFALQILFRREVEQDPDEQEWLRRARAVAVLGDEVPLHPPTQTAAKD
jgi:hypothetical protein